MHSPRVRRPHERSFQEFLPSLPSLLRTHCCPSPPADPVDIDLVGEGQTGKMADSITALAVQVRSCPRGGDVGLVACVRSRPLRRTAGAVVQRTSQTGLARRLSPAFCLHHSLCAMPQVPADARRSVLVDLLTVYGEGGKAIVFTQVGAGSVPAAGAGCWLRVVLRLTGAARPLCSRRWVQARCHNQEAAPWRRSSCASRARCRRATKALNPTLRLPSTPNTPACLLQTKREADEVAASVGGHLPCGALHGDMSQREREKCLASFRDKKVGSWLWLLWIDWIEGCVPVSQTRAGDERAGSVPRLLGYTVWRCRQQPWPTQTADCLPPACLPRVVLHPTLSKQRAPAFPHAADGAGGH